MKKCFLLGLFCSGVAFAQSDSQLILYGQLDQGLGYSRQVITAQDNGIPFAIKQSNTGGRSGVIGDSMVGLRAEQPIGGGNKIFIQLEERFDIGTGKSLKDRGTSVIGIGG